MKFEVVLYVSAVHVKQLLHLADHQYFSVLIHEFEQEYFIADGSEASSQIIAVIESGLFSGTDEFAVIISID